MELVINHKQHASTTSRLIAEKFGKRHANVLRAIKELECSEEFRQRNFELLLNIRELPEGGHKKEPEYIITKDGFTFLVMGFTGTLAAKFKEEFINAFNRMEDVLRQRHTHPFVFAARWAENQGRVAKDYFSVIGELYARLYRQFEMIGYIIPDYAFNGKEIRPDVSVGRCFANYLRDKHPELSDSFKTYMHRFPNGVEVEARQYPLDMIPTFYRYIDNVWIPEHAENYFKQRDTKALDYLPKLLKAS